jgi:hypothetical protein
LQVYWLYTDQVYWLYEMEQNVRQLLG